MPPNLIFMKKKIIFFLIIFLKFFVGKQQENFKIITLNKNQENSVVDNIVYNMGFLFKLQIIR